MAGEITFADFAPQGEGVSGLQRMIAEGRLPHALLISGEAGMGKRTLARLIARTLLCTGENPPCGSCPACVQVEKGEHPDWLVIHPGEALQDEDRGKGQGIVVNTIRKLQEIMAQAPYTGDTRCVCIEGAHRMNEQAQNALLKTLEEPPAGNTLLLVTDQPEMLLTTIRSRCSQVKLHPWPDETIRRILQSAEVPAERIQATLLLSEGSIGRAVEMAGDERFWALRQDVMRDFFGLSRRSDILAVSTRLRDAKQISPDELLDMLESMLRLLILCRLGRAEKQAVAGFPEEWQRGAQQGELKTLLSLLDDTAHARALSQSHVTWQACVEQLLLRMMEARNQWST